MAKYGEYGEPTVIDAAVLSKRYVCGRQTPPILWLEDVAQGIAPKPDAKFDFVAVDF